MVLGFIEQSQSLYRVTYEAVIAVRYPELDEDVASSPSFGVPPLIPFVQLLTLGLLLHDWISGQLSFAAGENGCLAVLHNRNDMVGAFNGSEWVSNSDGESFPEVLPHVQV